MDSPWHMLLAFIAAALAAIPPMRRVHRRKRRQAELSTRTAVASLQWFLDNITVDPGISTTVVVIFRGSRCSVNQAALELMTFTGYDAGTPAYGTTAPSTVSAVVTTEGVVVTAEYAFAAELTNPYAINIPKGWRGVVSSNGDTPGPSEPAGLGGDGWHQLVQFP